MSVPFWKFADQNFMATSLTTTFSKRTREYFLWLSKLFQTLKHFLFQNWEKKCSGKFNAAFYITWRLFYTNLEIGSLNLMALENCREKMNARKKWEKIVKKAIILETQRFRTSYINSRLLFFSFPVRVFWSLRQKCSWDTLN